MPLLKDAFLSYASGLQFVQTGVAVDVDVNASHRYASSAIEVLRSLNVTNIQEAILCLTLGKVLVLSVYSLIGVGAAEICQYCLNTAMVYTNATISWDQDVVSQHSFLMFMETIDCLVHCRKPTQRFPPQQAAIMDRYLGLCLSLLPYYYDLCVINHSMVNNTDTSYLVYLYKKLDEVRVAVDAWRPPPLGDLMHHVETVDMINLLAQAKVYRLAALLVIHRLRYPFGQQDGQANVWANEIMKEFELADWATKQATRCVTMPYIVAAVEIQDFSLRVRALENVTNGPAERALGIGRSFGAEWIRNAYHDMATADVFSGTGGLDASIVFEMDRPENVGDAFQETLNIFKGSYNTRISMADLFAIATVMAVGACSNGKVIVPFRGGRVDAVGPGPSGVPEPQQDLPTHTLSFAKQGFDTSEMIALVACGHSVGGVHGVDFPEIVPNPVPTTDIKNDNTVTFDTTTDNFDNFVAKEFVANISQNPLAFGQNETTRSDFRIFKADGGDMISRMASSNDFFLNTCNIMFERMINTVPRDVKLTDIIEPLAIKPRKLSVAINDNGTLLASGIIRVVDNLFSGSKTQVLIHLASRSGEVLPVAIGTTSRGLTGGCGYPNCGPSYTYYRFNSIIPAELGISSFTVETVDTATGKATIHNNGGAGFPMSDAILPMFGLSSQSRTTINGGAQLQLNLTVAVLNAEMFTNVSLIVPQPLNKSAPISPWNQEVVHMEPLYKISGTNFTLYRGIWQSSGPLTATSSHPFDIMAEGSTQTVSSLFNSWDDVEFI
ncbi:hypothetical protein TrVGV298_004734 [Trichoderma virens]|nr:hypothetical protein TrVGV298_004734 [Trichoderma virens]